MFTDLTVRQVIKLAGENTFTGGLRKVDGTSPAHGRQSSLEQIRRTFKGGVFPYLKQLTIYDVTRPHGETFCRASRRT